MLLYSVLYWLTLSLSGRPDVCQHLIPETSEDFLYGENCNTFEI